jgi:hypothetical protein
MTSSALDVSMTLSSQATDVFPGDDTDAYSEFDEDPEALALIDALLNEASSKSQAQKAFEESAPTAALEVTDIEDHEEPRGVRLPKVFGFEARRQRSSTQPQQQIICDEGGTLHTFSDAAVSLTG